MTRWRCIVTMKRVHTNFVRRLTLFTPLIQHYNHWITIKPQNCTVSRLTWLPGVLPVPPKPEWTFLCDSVASRTSRSCTFTWNVLVLLIAFRIHFQEGHRLHKYNWLIRRLVKIFILLRYLRFYLLIPPLSTTKQYRSLHNTYFYSFR